MSAIDVNPSVLILRTPYSSEMSNSRSPVFSHFGAAIGQFLLYKNALGSDLITLATFPTFRRVNVDSSLWSGGILH